MKRGVQFALLVLACAAARARADVPVDQIQPRAEMLLASLRKILDKVEAVPENLTTISAPNVDELAREICILLRDFEALRAFETDPGFEVAFYVSNVSYFKRIDEIAKERNIGPDHHDFVWAKNLEKEFWANSYSKKYSAHDPGRSTQTPGSLWRKWSSEAETILRSNRLALRELAVYLSEFQAICKEQKLELRRAMFLKTVGQIRYDEIYASPKGGGDPAKVVHPAP